MPEKQPHHEHEDESPVGDVRRVREELSQRFGNDVRRLGEHARQIGEKTAQELGCPVVRKSQAPASIRKG
jgi:hypothetical protein